MDDDGKAFDDDSDFWRDKLEHPYWKKMLARAEACYANLSKTRATTHRGDIELRMERRDCIQEFLTAASVVRDESDDSPQAWAHRYRCGVNAVKNHLRFAGRKLHNARRGVGESHPGVAGEIDGMVKRADEQGVDAYDLAEITPSPGKTPLEHLLAQEAREILLWAVDDLPERLRLVAKAWMKAWPTNARHVTEKAAAAVHRRTMEGEAADTMGVSREEAKDLTDRTLNSLKHRLSWHDYGLNDCLRYFAVTEREASHASRFTEKNLKRDDDIDDEDEEENVEDQLPNKPSE